MPLLLFNCFPSKIGLLLWLEKSVLILKVLLEIGSVLKNLINSVFARAELCSLPERNWDFITFTVIIILIFLSWYRNKVRYFHSCYIYHAYVQLQLWYLFSQNECYFNRELNLYILFKFSFIFQLMSKVAVLVGRKVTEELFLQRFLSLCEDKQNYVRKVSF